MSNEYTGGFEEGEETALAAIKESGDPMALVVYHMAMRQLATSERVVRLENMTIRSDGQLRRLVNLLERRFTNGSRPDFKAVVFEEG